MPISEINNSTYKLVVADLVGKKLSAQTIHTYLQPLKMVVASLVDKDANPIYPVKWNADAADLPIIDRRQQKRPSITAEEIERGLVPCRLRAMMLAALLACSGLRVGEALALKDTDVSADGRIVSVRHTIYRNIEQTPKSANAFRDVDIAPAFASLLARYVEVKRGYIFATESGGAWSQRKALRTLTAHFGEGGFHRLRRFRSERIEEAGVPDYLRKYWLGHARSSVSELYIEGLLRNAAYKREFAVKVGVGFELSAVENALLGYLGYKSEHEEIAEFAVSDAHI